MGQKDMVEKIMEDYPDVFADIVNVLLFDGKQVVTGRGQVLDPGRKGSGDDRPGESELSGRRDADADYRI